MNIIVLSDTHGKLDKALELIGRIETFADIDLIIHCGDFLHDALDIEEETGIEVVCVPGNCDGCFERKFRTVDVPGGRILVTHGHMEDVKYDTTRLLYLAEEQKCNIVCFGHSHVAVCEMIDGIRIINPGSPSRPRDGSDGSCALLVCEEGKTAATIIKY